MMLKWECSPIKNYIVRNFFWNVEKEKHDFKVESVAKRYGFVRNCTLQKNSVNASLCREKHK